MATSQSRVRELFDYGSDGILIRKVDRGGQERGEIAGCVNKDGYCQIGIDGKIYRRHRLIWLWHNKMLPRVLDHIDGNPLNDCIENLQSVTHSQNIMKSKDRKGTITGHRGIQFRKDRLKFQAYIIVEKKKIYLGLYNLLEDAIQARLSGELKYFGKYQPIRHSLHKGE